MKNILGSLFLLVTFLATAVIVLANESSFLDEVKESDSHFDSRAVPLIREVTEDSVLADEMYQGGSFRVLERKKKIGRYKCSSCHTDKKVLARNGLELTHGDVILEHGKNNQLNCIDCHHEEERNFLEDKKGNKIDFNHSYKLCGQCHFRQKSDWLGGAHGKRVTNWAGERVIFNCTTCHNPHSPRFEKRFPATYSVPLDK